MKDDSGVFSSSCNLYYVYVCKKSMQILIRGQKVKSYIKQINKQSYSKQSTTTLVNKVILNIKKENSNKNKKKQCMFLTKNYSNS